MMVKHPPLIDIPLNHVIVDELHLFFHITYIIEKCNTACNRGRSENHMQGRPNNAGEMKIWD